MRTERALAIVSLKSRMDSRTLVRERGRTSSTANESVGIPSEPACVLPNSFPLGTPSVVKSRPIHSSSRTQSVIERVNNGSPVDWADLLGVPFPCTPEELKRAHRDAARRHHPNVGGYTEMTKSVNIAKERLEKQLEWYWRLAV